VPIGYKKTRSTRTLDMAMEKSHVIPRRKLLSMRLLHVIIIP